MSSAALPRALRALVISMLAVLAVGVLSVVQTTPAHALCAAQPMAGTWRNIDSSSRSLTRVVVRFECGDVRLCDTDGNCSGGESYFTVRPLGSCSPTDCDWGSRRAQSMSDGWQLATYSHSWATKHVWVKTYNYYGRLYLRVYASTDFTATDGRQDYVTDEWMLK